MKKVRLFVLAALLIAPAALSHQLMDGPGPMPLCPDGTTNCVNVQ